MLQIGPGLMLPMLRSGGADVYGVLGFSPELVIDAVEDYYRANSAATTFADMVTTTATSNRTMVDSDGVLKWAPHNLLTYSAQFDNAAWTGDNSGAVNPTVTANYGAAPDGTTSADRIQLDKTGGTFSRLQQVRTGLSSAIYSFSVWLKNNSVGTANVGIRIEGVNLNCAVDENWQLFTVSLGSAGAGASAQILLFDSIPENDETADILAWGAHVYRSDLGGMVNNPDRGDSYVPTTSAAVYMPRRNHYIYNGTSWVKAGALFEPTAATNLVTYSNDFSNAAWLKSQTSVATNAAVAPTSEQVYALTENTATNEHYLGFPNTIKAASSIRYTFSIFVKRAAGTRNVGLGITDGTTGGYAAIFDPDDGAILSENHAVGSTTGWVAGDARVEDWGNGWWRFSYSATTNTATRVDAVVYLFNGTTRSYTGDGTSNQLVTGAQLEAGSVPSSYIPTAGSTATRAAETVTIAAAKVPYSATALWIQMEGYMTYADNDSFNPYFWRWYLDTSNYIQSALDHTSTRTGSPRFFQNAAGTVDQVAGIDAYTPSVNVPFNIASRHGSTFINGAVDGTALTADLTPVALPALSSTNLQLAYSGGPFIISKFRMGTGDPGDAGISEAST